MAEPAAYTLGQQGIDTSTEALVRQLAQLRAQAAQGNQFYTQNLDGAAALAAAGYGAGTNDLNRDLTAQGASSPSIGAQLADDQAQLAATRQRQADYIASIANNQQANINADTYNAYQQQAAAHAALAANYGQSLDSGGGGGGGGGGGYGHGGYGGGDYLTAGDASLEADLSAEPYNDTPVTSDAQRQVGNRPLDTLLGDYLYGTHGKGDQFLKGGFGHVNTFGNNAASLASKYARYAKAKFSKTWVDQNGNHHKAIDKHTLNRFLKNLDQEQRSVQGNHKANHARKVKQRQEHVKAQLRGLE